MTAAQLRVLHVIDSLAPGGAERSLVDLVPHLAPHGVSVDVAVLTERPGFSEELRRSGSRVLSLSGPAGRAGSLVRCRRAIRAVHPDIVHTSLFEADLVGRIAGQITGVSVVSSLVNETFGPEHRAETQSNAARWYGAYFADRATARLVDRFHAVSRSVADTMAPRLGIPAERIDVVPRGRDRRRLGAPSRDRRVVARRALGVEDSDTVLLALARHEPQKGLDTLLAALPLVACAIPRTLLLVAGREGNVTAALAQQAARPEVCDSVRLLGARADVADLLCAADVFVLPSRREGLPGAVIEAAAMDTPIVATDLPTTREVVPGDEYAWFVPVDDPESLARQVIRVIDEPEEARQRASRARARFEDCFTIEAVAARMAFLYRRVVA